MSIAEINNSETIRDVMKINVEDKIETDEETNRAWYEDICDVNKLIVNGWKDIWSFRTRMANNLIQSIIVSVRQKKKIVVEKYKNVFM